MSGKASRSKLPLLLVCWTLMVLDSEAISPALAGYLWLRIDSFQVEEAWPSMTTDSGVSPGFSDSSPHVPM